MKIKNYTTTIDAAKSIFEIEKMLSDSKATHIMKTYRGDGKIEALFFNISNVGYKLPANVEKVKVALKNSKSCSYSKLDDQSERVAWRVIRDWLHAQLSLIQIGQAQLDEIFLPYAYDGQQTHYEKVKKIGMEKTQHLLMGDMEVSK